MDRTLLKLEIVTGEASISVEDVFDTGFEETTFDLKSGKRIDKNKILLKVGDSIINRKGVTMTLIQLMNNTEIGFEIKYSDILYPFVGSVIYVREGLVAMFLDADEGIVMNCKPLYNLDKSIHEYIKSRFNKFPEIQFGKFICESNSDRYNVALLHNGYSTIEGNSTYVNDASFCVKYLMNGGKLEIEEIHCIDETVLPTLYRELFKMVYKVSSGYIDPSIESIISKL